MARGARGGRVGRPPGRKAQQQRQEREPSVHQSNGGNEEPNPPGGQEERLILEPLVRTAIAQEVAAVLRNTLPAALAEALPAALNEILPAAGITNQAAQTAAPVIPEETEDEADSDDSDFDMNRGCSYKTFVSCKPPSFDGGKDAIAASHWIDSMTEVIEMSECRADQEVKYAAHSFEGEALSWWKNVKKSKTLQELRAMRWEDLKALVTQKFIPQNEIDNLELEFAELKAGTMTHREFTTRFNELTAMVPHMVSTEERRIKTYIQKLPPKVRTIMSANSYTTFASVVALSAKIYDNMKADGSFPTETQKKQFDNKKRNADNWKDSPNKKSRTEPVGACKKCGRLHYGECKAGMNVCYRCGKAGHFSKDCPGSSGTVFAGKCNNCGITGHQAKDCRKPKVTTPVKDKEANRAGPSTRAYALTTEEAKGNAEVVSGIKGKDKA